MMMTTTNTTLSDTTMTPNKTDNLSLTGDVEIYLNDKLVLQKKNLVVSVGKGFLAQALISSSTTPFNSIAIGTGTTAPTTSDTSLQAESGRVALQSSFRTGNIVWLICTFPSNGIVGTITEAGIFNSLLSGQGVLLSRIVFSPIIKTVTDALTINWVVRVN